MTDYLEALNRMCQPVRREAYPATLRPMQDLLAALDNPHEHLQAVVVTGSTGKGTTCHRIARLLRAATLKVGLYTSPHLHSFRERFVFDDAMISREAFIAGAQAVQVAAVSLDHAYSTFEQATALALWWFARQQPDVVVLEIGLGGRWDAVNVVDNLLAVFTPIEAEHTAMLGGSVESVAWHKAGIIRPGGQALSVWQTSPVEAVLRAEATAQKAALHIVDSDDLAWAAAASLHERGLIPAVPVLRQAAFDALPGRLEWIDFDERPVLIDGGHTPAAARHLREAIDRRIGEHRPVRLIVGMLSDKNARAFLEVFDSPQVHVVFTRAPGHRAAAPEALAALDALHHATVEIAPDLDAALNQVSRAPEPLVVVAGSLRMAAAAREAFGLLSPEMLDEARATRAIFEGASYLAKLPPTEQTGSATPAE